MAQYQSWHGYLDGDKHVLVINAGTARFGSETEFVPAYKVRRRIHIGYTERAYNLYDYADPTWVRASRVKKRKFGKTQKTHTPIRRSGGE
jgi:hypothetical protein